MNCAAILSIALLAQTDKADPTTSTNPVLARPLIDTIRAEVRKQLMEEEKYWRDRLAREEEEWVKRQEKAVKPLQDEIERLRKALAAEKSPTKKATTKAMKGDISVPPFPPPSFRVVAKIVRSAPEGSIVIDIGKGELITRRTGDTFEAGGTRFRIESIWVDRVNLVIEQRAVVD